MLVLFFQYPVYLRGSSPQNISNATRLARTKQHPTHLASSASFWRFLASVRFLAVFSIISSIPVNVANASSMSAESFLISSGVTERDRFFTRSAKSSIFLGSGYFRAKKSKISYKENTFRPLFLTAKVTDRAKKMSAQKQHVHRTVHLSLYVQGNAVPYPDPWVSLHAMSKGLFTRTTQAQA